LLHLRIYEKNIYVFMQYSIMDVTKIQIVSLVKFYDNDSMIYKYILHIYKYSITLFNYYNNYVLFLW